MHAYLYELFPIQWIQMTHSTHAFDSSVASHNSQGSNQRIPHMSILIGTGHGPMPTAVVYDAEITRKNLVRPWQATRGYGASSTATVAIASANRTAAEQADAATRFTPSLETKT